MSGRVAVKQMPRTYQLVALGNRQSKIRCGWWSTATQLRSYASKPEDQTDDMGGQEQAKRDKMHLKLESLLQELSQLKEEKISLVDKYKRALADRENMRMRMNKQIDEAKAYGIQTFCKDLLEVADTLGHATAAVPRSELTDKNPHLKNLYEGLTITQCSLLQIFKRHGLVAMNPLNEQFNPNLHEALFQVSSKSAKPNTIVEVTKLGYSLRDRCIRPALVGVAKSN